ncbi:hypothetical protein F5884DRAFT_305618 [Xylogone sp. PMI_703]|nr:hypothetical protein F5884DRAFT_305618 [Xylogone sp. PMI_703]
MVFPGRFSTGCLRCRQRKVKCDETKPTCRRCAIYGKPCTGYTDQFHFRHSGSKRGSEKGSLSPSATAVAVQQQEQQEQKQVPEQKQEEEQDQCVSNRAESQAMIRAPVVSYDEVSLSYFIHRFVSPNGPDGFPGHLTFLPSIYDSYSHGILETATLSVAQMAAYNQFGGEKFRVQSYKNYGRTIRMMQEVIQSEEQATDDKVLASILLLCTLKDITGENSGDPNEHAPGLYYLIDKRGDGQLATNRGAELLVLALIRLQIYAFLCEDDTYSDPGSIATVWGAVNPLLRAMSMMSKTLSLRLSLLRHYTSLESRQQQGADYIPMPHSDSEEQDIMPVIEKCFEALDDFHAWDTEAASYWHSMFEGRGVPTGLGEIASGQTYYDVETACTIVLIRSARLILVMSMIAYYRKMQFLDNCQEGMLSGAAVLEECMPVLEQDVGKTIDDILSCMPYALGDIDPNGLPQSLPHDGAAAIIIVHSIRLVGSCAYATTDQFQKAMSALTRFNSSIGIRSAVDLGKVNISKSRWVQEQAFLRSIAPANSGVVSFSPPQYAMPE